MPSNEPEPPDESFFNDLSQQPHESNTVSSQEAQQDGPSKVKRIACVLCRKRKLRCDGARPSCSTCKRLSHDCGYDEVRKKSGPKRGYVKLLEQRLQQVETLLKTQDSIDAPTDASRRGSAAAYVANIINQTLPDTSEPPNASQVQTPDAIPLQNAAEQHGSWDMIGLGLEEPLPPQEVMDDLYQIYFSKVHPTIPIIHRPRFLAALNLAPNMRPPVCLRYIMWTMAASVTDKYEALQEHFYHRARKYAQMDEMRGHGETAITLAHCQMWILTCTYEFKNMHFPRAWLSAGRAVRFAQMMQLHRLDGVGLEVKQCLPPPKDWTEREERRRSFWMAFCVDRYASIGTGWPMMIDERDIMTNLPASEEAYEKSRAMDTPSLEQVMQPNGAAKLQSFGGIVLTAAMFGRNLLHLHRPGPADRDNDINGGYWNRHRSIEQLLLQTSLGLPDHMRLPSGLADPNVVFTNMCIHTSTICLHQAAIFKADKYRLPTHIGNESKIRCVTAAAEIANLMRMVSHMDLGAMNPFISFCIYVAARVYVQYLKTRPSDQQMASSLQFLLQAMQALRRKNPLTDSFLAQLDLDLESAGIKGVQYNSNTPTTVNPPYAAGENSTVRCNVLMNIVETNSSTVPSNSPGNSDLVETALKSNTRYVQNTPGPPFHLSNINSIGMHTRNMAFMESQMSSRGGSTTAMQPELASGGFAMHDGNEMDLSGGDKSVDHSSPATISSQSRGGSTSHSSYSPGQQNEHQIPYRESPKAPHSGLASGSTTGFSGFVSTSEAFSTNAFDTSGMGNDFYGHNLMVGDGWDYAGLNAGTDITSMADASWDTMLESVTMGWESTGHLHDSQTNIFGAR